jgi:HAD superfamily hydrolase (TIGR01484 family)
MSKTEVVSSFDELAESGKPITKIFAASDDLVMLKDIEKQLRENPNLAVASSFENNLEVTDINAQKGIVLKNYIESLGYTMDEVMVFGDSMNDYSMLSMDFGVTVAMENGADKVKEVSKYVTKSNIEDGVAYVIEELLKRRH